MTKHKDEVYIAIGETADILARSARRPYCGIEIVSDYTTPAGRVIHYRLINEQLELPL